MRPMNPVYGMRPVGEVALRLGTQEMQDITITGFYENYEKWLSLDETEKPFEFRCHIATCKTTGQGSKLMTHFSFSHTDAAIPIIPCPMCDMVFLIPEHLFNHLHTHAMEKVNFKDRKNIVCSICKRGFVDPVHFRLSCLPRKGSHRTPLHLVRMDCYKFRAN